MPLDDTRSQGLTGLGTSPLLYRCRQCGHIIARAQDLLPVGGDHEHVVFNPSGMVFRVWCFADAVGLALIGAPSWDFTWFRFYGWRIALCRECRTHLGWRYDGDGDPRSFYGLIRDRLAEGPAE